LSSSCYSIDSDLADKIIQDNHEPKKKIASKISDEIFCSVMEDLNPYFMIISSPVL